MKKRKQVFHVNSVSDLPKINPAKLVDLAPEETSEELRVLVMTESEYQNLLSLKSAVLSWKKMQDGLEERPCNGMKILSSRYNDKLYKVAQKMLAQQG